MNIEILEEFGLTRTEVKIYMALLESGSTSAGSILEKSKLPNSTVHRDLNSLIDKGLVSFILEGKRKIYTATEPDYFFNLIEDRKKRFEALLPELKEKQKTSQKQGEASIYKGIKGIKEVYSQMINTKGGEYLTLGGGPPTEKLMGLTWWLNLHNRRIANKISSRQIFDMSVKNIGGTEISKKKLTDIRYLSSEFAQFQETVIVGNKVAIAVFTENPYAFMIEDEKVAEGYKKYFEALWKLTKK